MLRFVEVKKSNPCPICGKNDWCSVSTDGHYVCCRRVNNGIGKEKLDRSGGIYWLYNSLEPFTVSNLNIDDTYVPAREDSKRADPDTLCNVHSALLNLLSLNKTHLDNLIGRGLSEACIQKNQYRTFPLRGRSKIARELLRQFGPEVICDVPGFYIKQDGGKQWVTIAGSPGLLIPVRDRQARILGFKIRLDDPPADGEGKYRWLSSNGRYHGTGQVNLVHYPLFNGETDAVRVTEGELKADISTVLSGTLTISLPGVNCWQSAIPALADLNAKTVLLAFDSDFETNINVVTALHALTEKLIELKYEVILETWDDRQGKGIDDLLAAGHEPKTATDKTEILKLLSEIKSNLEIEDPVPEAAEITRIKQALQKVEETKDIAIAYDNIGALAVLPAVELGKYKAKFKEVLGSKLNLNDFTRALNEEKKRRESQRAQLRVVGDGDAAERIPSLVEDGCGYVKQIITETGGVEEKVLSNFILEIKERLTLATGEEVLVINLQVNGRYVKTMELQCNAFLTYKDLLKHLQTTETVWLGSDWDVQLLRAHLLKKDVTRCRGVEMIGRHGDHIVLPGMVLSKNGIVENPSLKLVDSYNHNLIQSLKPKWPTQKEHMETARAVYKYLPRVNEPHIAGAIIAWTFALPWCDLIRKTPGFGGFPHLVIWGEAGCGKTETGKLIWRLCGVPPSFDPYALPKTRFTRLRNYSITNLIPVFLDEYRPGAWHASEAPRIHEELRNVYNHAQDERGTSSLGAKQYPMASPVIVCGEDRPRDTAALEERIISLAPSKDVIEGERTKYGQECQKVFGILNEIELQNFSLPYWVWALTQKNWKQALKKQREEILRWKEKTNFPVPNRMINNFAILGLGWSMFHRYAEYLEIVPAGLLNNTGFGLVLTSLYLEILPNAQQHNEFDELMMFIATMVVNNKLRRNTHYAKKPDGTIVLRLQDILPVAGEYARRTGRRKELLGIDAYFQMVDSLTQKEDSYVTSRSDRARFEGYWNETRQLRGVGINIHLLEKCLGIEPEIWE